LLGIEDVAGKEAISLKTEKRNEKKRNEKKRRKEKTIFLLQFP